MNYADYIDELLAYACRLEGYIDGMGGEPRIGEVNVQRLSKVISILKALHEEVTLDE